MVHTHERISARKIIQTELFTGILYLLGYKWTFLKKVFLHSRIGFGIEDFFSSPWKQRWPGTFTFHIEVNTVWVLALPPPPLQCLDCDQVCLMCTQCLFKRSSHGGQEGANFWRASVIDNHMDSAEWLECLLKETLFNHYSLGNIFGLSYYESIKVKFRQYLCAQVWL